MEEIQRILDQVKWVRDQVNYDQLPMIQNWTRTTDEMEVIIKHQAKQIEDLSQLIIELHLSSILRTRAAKILVRPVDYN